MTGTKWEEFHGGLANFVFTTPYLAAFTLHYKDPQNSSQDIEELNRKEYNRIRGLLQEQDVNLPDIKSRREDDRTMRRDMIKTFDEAIRLFVAPFHSLPPTLKFKIPLKVVEEILERKFEQDTYGSDPELQKALLASFQHAMTIKIKTNSFHQTTIAIWAGLGLEERHRNIKLAKNYPMEVKQRRRKLLFHEKTGIPRAFTQRQTEELEKRLGLAQVLNLQLWFRRWRLVLKLQPYKRGWLELWFRQWRLQRRATDNTSDRGTSRSDESSNTETDAETANATMNRIPVAETPAPSGNHSTASSGQAAPTPAPSEPPIAAGRQYPLLEKAYVVVMQKRRLLSRSNWLSARNHSLSSSCPHQNETGHSSRMRIQRLHSLGLRE